MGERKSKLFRGDIVSLFRSRRKGHDEIFNQGNNKAVAEEGIKTPSFKPKFDEVTFPNAHLKLSSPQNLIFKVSKISSCHMSCDEITDGKRTCMPGQRKVVGNAQAFKKRQ